MEPVINEGWLYLTALKQHLFSTKKYSKASFISYYYVPVINQDLKHRGI